ncbi:MAG TPA: OmpA family protein [Bryobacteraceae bacterium]|nr:OmpA family protein [Bryobacteraceae bacterium]
MRLRFLACAGVAALCVTLGACKKNVAAAKTTPPAPVASTPAPAASRPVARSTPSRPAPSAPSTRSRMPDAATRARIQDLLNRIQDAYFDYDKHTIRPDAEAALKTDAQTLADIIRQYPDFKLTVEGHCDERGSEEYNLALGDARAKQAKEYLASLGLPDQQLNVISYGKDKPVCADHDEACWQKNRRAHITQAQAQ